MPIKKRGPVASPSSGPADELSRRAEEFGKAGYAPQESVPVLDPNAPLSKLFPLRVNEYQKQLLQESAAADRRSQQKLLESLIWPELERRRAERHS